MGFSQSGTKLNMRGYSDKPGTLILVDGVRATDAGDGTFLWNSVPLGDIERIEIIRGGASTTYGEGAIGGVVNIVTKHASLEPVSGTVTGAVGNLGYYTASVQASGTEGLFSYRLAGDRQSWDGWRAYSRFNCWSASAAPKLNTAVGSFTLKNRYFQNSSEDPGNLTFAQYQTDPRQAGAFQTFSTNWEHHASLNYEKEIGNEWTVLGQVYAQKYDSHTESVGFIEDTRQPNFGATLQTTYKREIAGHENALTFGSEAVNQDFSQVSNFSTSIVDYWTASGFIQDTLDLGTHLTLTAGARYDYREWRVDAVDTAFGSYNFNQGESAGVWSGKLGLNYALAEKSDAWLSLSRAFRLPTGSDISSVNFMPGTFAPILFYPNPNIKPVDARTIDAGVRSDYSKWLGGSLGYYYSQVKNDIVFDPFSFENVNFDSRKQGVELNLHSRPSDWFGLYVNAAWTDSQFDGGPMTASNSRTSPPARSARG